MRDVSEANPLEMCPRPTSLISSQPVRSRVTRDVRPAAMYWRPRSVIPMHQVRSRVTRDVRPAAMYWRPRSVIGHQVRSRVTRDVSAAEMCWTPRSVMFSHQPMLREGSDVRRAATYWRPTSLTPQSKRSRTASDVSILKCWTPRSVIWRHPRRLTKVRARQVAATIPRCRSLVAEYWRISFSSGRLLSGDDVPLAIGPTPASGELRGKDEMVGSSTPFSDSR